MRLGLKKAWLWTKLAVICLVVVWVTLFFVFNRGPNHETDVWLFPTITFYRVPLDLVVPVTALAALVVFYVVRKVTGVLHQLSVVSENEKKGEQDRKMTELARQMEHKLSAVEPPKDAGPRP